MGMDDKEKNKITKKQYIRDGLLERQSEARVVRKVILIVVAVIVLLGAAIGIGGYFYVSSALKPANPDDKSVKVVEIPINSSIGGISEILESKGIIKNARVFKYYIKFRNEAGFQAGKYNLSPSMNFKEIVSSIKTGKVMKQAALKITIPEGKQLVQIAGIIADKTGRQPDTIFKELNNKAFVLKMREKYPNLLKDEIYNKNVMYPLEGYLYPATYEFFKTNPSLDEIVSQMLKKTDDSLRPYQSDIAAKKFTPHKLLTMSSLIEEEATEQVDRSKIASVFYNRLKAGMPLQTDPTVLYAKGQHQKKVFYKDLKVLSPYNTYKNKGLPPGPISNAGKISIEAALKPAKTDYLYFLATGDGRVLYSKTLAEHNRLKAEHITDKN
ncbi:endolytic transglycosylase MltG [Actinomycetes bacterium NPDC127524]